MTRDELKKALLKEAAKGFYDFVVVDAENGDPDGAVPVCDRVPVSSVVPNDPRWAWLCGESRAANRVATFILFASKEDELEAERFVSNIKHCKA